MLYLIFDCEMNGGKFVRKIRMDDFFLQRTWRVWDRTERGVEKWEQEFRWG